MRDVELCILQMKKIFFEIFPFQTIFVAIRVEISKLTKCIRWHTEVPVSAADESSTSRHSALVSWSRPLWVEAAPLI